MPQDLPKHSRNEQITAKFGSLAQEASLSDAIFPPLLSGPVAARRYTTLGDLTTRIAFSSNYFRSSLLSHSLFVKKTPLACLKGEKWQKTFENVRKLLPASLLSLPWCSVSVTHTRIKTTNGHTRPTKTNEKDEDREKRNERGKKKKHTRTCVIVLNFHSIFVLSFGH